MNPSCLQQVLVDGKSLTLALEILTCFVDNSYRQKRSNFETRRRISLTRRLIIVIGTALLSMIALINRSKIASLFAQQVDPTDVSSKNNEESQFKIKMKKEKFLELALELPEVQPPLLQETNACGDEKEGVTRRLLITLNNQTFDLSTEVGKQKWKETIQRQCSKITEPKLDNLESNSKVQVDENVRITPSLQSESIKVETGPAFVKSHEPRKAREDINIHDPFKPVPSILDHPVVDGRGKPLRRIFIPGRGWVSSKTLALEKSMLIRQCEVHEQIEGSASY